MGWCVLCGAGGYYAFEVNTFFTQYFHFCRSARKESDPADFFQTLALLHRTFFIYFYYTLTLQSSPPRYMWLTCPHPFARVWAPWHFCKKKNRDSLPPLQRCWTRRRLIPNPNAENTARSQLYGEKKKLSSSTLEICAHPDPEQSHSKYNLLSKGAARSFATAVQHNPCLRDIAFPSAIDCTGKHYCESGWVFL